MVKRFLTLFGREINGLHEAAYLLGVFALLSQVLGFLRDRLFASTFGAGETLDLYFAAFRVPDFIFIVGASVVSLSVLIPFLSQKIAEGKERAREFLDTVFSAFFLSIVAVGAIAYILAPYLTGLLFPGFGEAELLKTAMLMRIMLLQPILLGVSNLFASVTQLERRFFVYAVSPLFYNLGIIAGVLFLYPLLGVSGLAWGVVLGAFLHLAVQIPVLLRSGLFPRFVFPFRVRELASVMAVSLPRTAALSAQNLSVLTLTALGSLFGAGSIAVFNFAWNLQSVPLSIVGASYSLAAFPTLSVLWSGGNREKFLETLSSAVRHILFWSFPALILFIVLRAQIVRAVLGSGAFDWADTRLTAASLALFAVSVVAQSLVLIFTRAYYAAGKTRVPFFISLSGAAATIFFAFLFSRLFSDVALLRFFLESLLRVSDLPGTSMLALPLSYSVGALGAAAAFWFFWSRQFKRFEAPVWRTFGESFAASVIMGFVAYLALNFLDNVFNIRTALGIFMQGLGAGVTGISVGVGVLWLLGNREIREIWRTLHRKIWRAKFIGPDPTDTTF
jgi:putative peptidoglycan lipid II flippase